MTKQIKDWLSLIEQTCSPSTLETYTRVLKQMYNLFGNPKEWTNQTITEYLSWCTEQGNSACTRNNKLQALRSFVRTTGLNLNPPSRIPFFQTVPLSATEEEIDKLLQHTKGKYKIALLLMADAGLREAEVRALHWKNITDSKILVHGKGNKTRIVPVITKRLSTALHNPSVPEEDFVIPGRQGGISRTQISRHISSLADKLKLRHITAHSLRHRFACRAAKKGIASVAIQQALGHSSLTTTEGYLRSLEGDEKFLSESFANF